MAKTAATAKFKEKGSNRIWIQDSNSPAGKVRIRRLHNGKTLGNLAVEFSQADFRRKFSPIN